MMDERELILGKAEQEQKEALLPKAILTPPWNKKNNHERQQKPFSLHVWNSSPACQGGPRPNSTFVYSLSCTPSSGRLLTDADEKAIFHKVRVKREREKNSKTKKGSGISWKRYNRIRAEREAESD